MPDPKLKSAAAEIEAVLKRHDIAGMVVLSSVTHTEYLLHLNPTWSPCYCETRPEGRVLRFKAKRADYPSKEAHDLAVSNGISLIMGFLDTGRSVNATLEDAAKKLAGQIEFSHFTRHEGNT